MLRLSEASIDGVDDHVIWRITADGDQPHHTEFELGALAPRGFTNETRAVVSVPERFGVEIVTTAWEDGVNVERDAVPQESDSILHDNDVVTLDEFEERAAEACGES